MCNLGSRLEAQIELKSSGKQAIIFFTTKH